MKRKTTPEERDLFLSALSGRLPTKRARAKQKTPKTDRAKTEKPKTGSPKLADQDGEPRGKSRSRRATADEEALFRSAVLGHVPVKPAPAAAKAKTAPPAAQAKMPKPGVDGNTMRRLTRGEITPTAKLDLHGLTEAAAHSALTAYVLSAHRRGDRLVLVVTGKGPGGDGVLRRNVPRWLAEAPMAKIIAEMRAAHRRHGGDGALYVYLRKR